MQMTDVESTLADLRDHDVVHRIWTRDHTVWKPDPEEITNRLGWLGRRRTYAASRRRPHRLCQRGPRRWVQGRGASRDGWQQSRPRGASSDPRKRDGLSKADYPGLDGPGGCEGRLPTRSISLQRSLSSLPSRVERSSPTFCTSSSGLSWTRASATTPGAHSSR